MSNDDGGRETQRDIDGTPAGNIEGNVIVACCAEVSARNESVGDDSRSLQVVLPLRSNRKPVSDELELTCCPAEACPFFKQNKVNAEARNPGTSWSQWPSSDNSILVLPSAPCL